MPDRANEPCRPMRPMPIVSPATSICLISLKDTKNNEDIPGINIFPCLISLEVSYS